MSVQPIEEVRKVLTYAVSEIPSEKILMGMPNYGYDWTLPYTRGTAAQSIGFIAATDLAVQHNSEIHFDEISQTPYFNSPKTVHVTSCGLTIRAVSTRSCGLSKNLTSRARRGGQ